MSGSTSDPGANRLVKIAVRDRHARPAPEATIEISVNGQAAGSISTGMGVAESTIYLNDPNSSVAIRVEFSGQVQYGYLAPGQDHIRFDFQTVLITKAMTPPIARWPDGTAGSPCVVCQVGNDHVKICV